MHRYPPRTIHRYLDLPSTQIIYIHNSHRHNTTPPLHTIVQAPYPLPTYTTTPPQLKHRHTSNTSLVPTGLVNPKPNLLIHSSPSPLTPPEPNYTSQTFHQLHPTPSNSTKLKTNKSPFPKSYLHKVDAKSHTSPLCSLCNTHLTYTIHIISLTATT